MKTKTYLSVLFILVSLIPLIQPAFATSSTTLPHGKERFFRLLIITTNIYTVPVLPGTGFYRLNTVVRFTAPATLVGLNGNVLHFNHWTWDYLGNSLTGQVTITDDMAIKAIYS